ncbi:MAG: hypothetical protein DHS20C21_01750 [Gemmatimonadota bacterium]|nr:MAG: hypothetical protein DHS20C21_01750 [Gemmatimonadota bacterium]
MSLRPRCFRLVCCRRIIAALTCSLLCFGPTGIASAQDLTPEQVEAAMARLRADFERDSFANRASNFTQSLALVAAGAALAVVGHTVSSERKDQEVALGIDARTGRWEFVKWSGVGAAVLGAVSAMASIPGGDPPAEQ